MKRLYELFLKLRYLKYTKSDVLSFKKLYMEEWDIDKSVAKDAEIDVFDHELSSQERAKNLDMLVDNNFIGLVISGLLDDVPTISNVFFKLEKEIQLNLLKFELRLREESEASKGTLHMMNEFLLDGISTDYLPEIYCEMTTENLKKEIETWDKTGF